MVVTEQRQKLFDFTAPVVDIRTSIFVSAERIGIENLTDLQGLRVGVASGGMAHQIVLANSKIHLVPLSDDPTEGFQMLRNGSLDAMVADYWSTNFVIVERDVKGVLTVGEPVSTRPSMFAVRKGNAELVAKLNSALAAMQKDGTFDRIYEKWKPKEIIVRTREQALRTTYHIGIGVLALLLCVGGGWIFSLKREIIQRRQAEEELEQYRHHLESLVGHRTHELAMQNEELQQSQLALEETKARLIDAQALTKVGSWETDLSNLHVIWSAQTYKIFDLDPNTFQASHPAFLEFVHPLDKADLDAAFLNSFENSSDNVIEHRVVTARGTIKHVEERWSIVRDDQGTPLRAVGTCQDITERKEAEAALQASNVQLQLLGTCVSRLNDIVMITEAEPFDEPGPRIVFVNDAFVRRTGYSREEVIGQTPRILQGAKTQRSELDRIGAALRRWEPVRAELINYTKAGQEFWLELDIVPIANAQGWYTHWVAVERDITERKQTQDALRASEERRKIATDSGRVAIWEVDLKTNHLVWDDNCFALYQLRKEDFDGTFDAWSRTIHPQDLDAAVQGFQNAVAGTSEYDQSFRIVWPDGTVRYVQAYGEVLRDKDGNPERVIGTNWDITEGERAQAALTESERSLNEAQALAQVGSYRTDLKTGTWTSSPALDQIFGMDAAFVRTIENWGKLMAPGYEQKMLDYYERVVHGDGKFKHDYEIVRPSDGQKRWVSALGTFVYDDYGTPLFLKGTIQDITDRKQTELALESSLKDKDALLKEVHHRVKNNMQVISSLLRMESRRTTTESTKAVLGDMQARIRAMALLHESLYRTGTFASVDLGSYLRQLATQSFRAQATISGAVGLELDLSSVQVSMDQGIPCGLLTNELISNCFKHGFPTGVTGLVRIELHPLDTARQWRLQVCDTGVGLPVNFEEKRKNSLGLQLAVDLARQIGGELTIERNHDKGVSFTVNFQALEPAALVMPA